MKNEQGQVATFAGGCFWCTQHAFDGVEGVISTTVGYTGGTKVNPSYEEVCSGSTGHVEAIQVVFDPSRISYEQLLNEFWHQIDPAQSDGQFCDVGSQYRTVIFYHNDLQKKLAEKSLQNILKMGTIENIYVKILPATDFYPAEAYHQEFYKKNPTRYKSYHHHSGRTRRLRELWG